MWLAERRGAVVLLAEIVDRDAQLLRTAATGEWVSTAARDLLIDAATGAVSGRPLSRCRARLV
jgi:hypothetical protein